jgi:hypothetical protein
VHMLVCYINHKMHGATLKMCVCVCVYIYIYIYTHTECPKTYVTNSYWLFPTPN